MFLTLVIALGGIVTGISAIWAAMLARPGSAHRTEPLRAEGAVTPQLEVNLLHRMQDRFYNQLFIGRRSAVARYFLDKAFVDDRMGEGERSNEAAIDVCDFF